MYEKSVYKLDKVFYMKNNFRYESQNITTQNGRHMAG